MSDDAATLDLTDLPRPILADHPEWVALYDTAWQLAANNVRQTRGRDHMCCAWDPNRNWQWVWDTCFIALYCRYSDGQLPGMAALDNFYDLQSDDGYISMTYDMDNGKEPWPNRINPPLFAWVEWEHYQTTGDASRFETVAPKIEKLMQWIEDNRRTQPHRRRCATDSPDAGRGESQDSYQLYYFVDCGSSGMDNSPRTPRMDEAGQFFDWIDLSSQVALSARCLSQIFDVMGNASRAAHWSARCKEIGELINTELWCEPTRFYHDRLLPVNFVNCKSAAGFWPMLAGVCPPERVQSLAEHLRDEKSFGRPVPVPSLSADDPNYDAKGAYWLGGVWAPTNYMVTRGLTNVGQGDLAHDIASRYLAAIAEVYETVEPATFWEAYSSEYREPATTAYTGNRVRPNFVGWTGLGPIAMLIENILGIDIDVPHKHITWTIRQTCEHGLSNIVMGDGKKARLHCKPRDSASAPAEVTLRSDEDITVTLSRGIEQCDVKVSGSAEPITVIV